MQLRLTALRSALKKAAPLLRDLDILPRGRAGRGLREGRPAPGSLAEGAINYSSAGMHIRYVLPGCIAGKQAHVHAAWAGLGLREGRPCFLRLCTCKQPAVVLPSCIVMHMLVYAACKRTALSTQAASIQWTAGRPVGTATTIQPCLLASCWSQCLHACLTALHCADEPASSAGTAAPPAARTSKLSRFYKGTGALSSLLPSYVYAC